MDETKNRRRILFVDRPMQNRIILSVAWAPALALTVTSLMLLWFCNNLAAEAEATRQELPSLLPTYVTVLGFLGFAATFVMMTALRTSHRVVGPVVAFKRTFDSIKAGDLSSRTRLRDGDYLTGVADEVNGFLEWLEENEGRIPLASEQPDADQVESGQDLPTSAELTCK